MMENYNDLLTETAPAEQSDYDKASWKNRKKAEREEAFARVADSYTLAFETDQNSSTAQLADTATLL